MTVKFPTKVQKFAYAKNLRLILNLPHSAHPMRPPVPFLYQTTASHPDSSLTFKADLFWHSLYWVISTCRQQRRQQRRTY